jgi:hypothetical protein
MKNLVIILLLVVMVLYCTTGCYTFDHRVGSGGKGKNTKDKGAWFILWGLVPLNTVDSQWMAGSADNYDVTTRFTFLDVIISIFTSLVSIHKQTVSIET